MARKFAAAIDAPLILSAPSVPINVTNIFKASSARRSERTAPAPGGARSTGLSLSRGGGGGRAPSPA
eukprot:6477406-Prymnesium_polylepis.1